MRYRRFRGPLREVLSEDNRKTDELLSELCQILKKNIEALVESPSSFSRVCKFHLNPLFLTSSMGKFEFKDLGI